MSNTLLTNILNAFTFIFLSFILGGWWLLLTLPFIFLSLIFAWVEITDRKAEHE